MFKRWRGCLLLLVVLALAGCGEKVKTGPRRVRTPDEQYLYKLAEDTWRYLDSHLAPQTGFPTDTQRSSGATNTTNIGLYLACLGPAERMGFISHDSAVARARKIIVSFKRLESRHGFTPQWVSVEGDTRISDGVWAVSDFNKMVAGLIMVRQCYPELAAEASPLIERIDWSWLYDKGTGQAHWGMDLKNDRPFGPTNFWLASDCRLAVFTMIASGGAPPEFWDRMERRKFDDGAGLWFYFPGYEMGGLFMHAMCGIFLDERGTEMGVSTANLAWHEIREQQARKLPVWGWSNCNIPCAGYTEGGFLPWWVVTPHASALVIEYYPKHVIRNLRALEKMGVRTPLEAGKAWGFRDSVDIRSGKLDDRYLSLDQGMLFLSLANYLEDGMVRKIFGSDPLVKKGYQLLGKRMQPDPRQLVEWAKRDATEPAPLAAAAVPDTRVLDFRRDTPVCDVGGAVKATATTAGLVLDYDLGMDGGGEVEARVHVSPPVDARVLGDMILRLTATSEQPMGGVRVQLRDEQGQTQYGYVGGLSGKARDIRLRRDLRYGFFARPQSVTQVIFKFWGRPWYYASQRTAAPRGSLLIESIEFLPGTENDTVTIGTGRVEIADFESGDRRNLLDGEFGAWASTNPNGFSSDVVVPGKGYKNSLGWRIEYDITTPGTFSGTWMKLGGLPFKKDGMLFFRIRGDGAFAPSCIVELKSGGQVGRVPVKGIGKGWTLVGIPLKSFSGLGDAESLTEMTFVFDQQTCSVKKGAYVVDDIAIE